MNSVKKKKTKKRFSSRAANAAKDLWHVEVSKEEMSEKFNTSWHLRRKKCHEFCKQESKNLQLDTDFISQRCI